MFITILLLFYYFIIIFINLSLFKNIFLYALYIKWQDILESIAFPNVFVHLSEPAPNAPQL